MSSTIGLINSSAARASSARVSGINCDNRNARHARLVGHELAKLGERPSMQSVALSLPGLNPLANMRQIFNGNRKTVAFGVRNDLLGDAVVDVLSEVGLPTRELLEPPLGGLGAASLKPATATVKMLASALGGVAGVSTPMAIKGKVHDAKVNAKNALDIDLVGIWNVADASKVELAAHEHQIDLAFAEGKKRPLTFTANERDLLTTIDGPDAYSFWHQPDNPVVVWLGRVFTELDHLRLVTTRFVCRVGVGHLGDAANSDLSRNAELIPSLGVGQLVKIKLARLANFKTSLREEVASLVAKFKRATEQVCLRLRRLELNVRNELHDLKYGIFSAVCQRQEAAAINFKF